MSFMSLYRSPKRTPNIGPLAPCRAYVLRACSDPAFSRVRMTSASVRRAAGALAVAAAGMAEAPVTRAGFAAPDFAEVAVLGVGAREAAGFTDFGPGRRGTCFIGFFVGIDEAYLYQGAFVASAARVRVTLHL